MVSAQPRPAGGEQGFRALLDLGDALQRQRARDEQAELADGAAAAAPQPKEVHRLDAAHFAERVAHIAGKPLRRRIDQRVDRASAETEAGHRDEQGDRDRRERIAGDEAEAGGEQSGKHEGGADEIAGIVQGVGFERLAAGFPGDAHQRAPAERVDGDRGDDGGEGERIGVDGGVVGQAQERLVGDAAGEHEEKAGLRQRGDRLDLGVPERVAFVGRLVGDRARRNR